MAPRSQPSDCDENEEFYDAESSVGLHARKISLQHVEGGILRSLVNNTAIPKKCETSPSYAQDKESDNAIKSPPRVHTEAAELQQQYNQQQYHQQQQPQQQQQHHHHHHQQQHHHHHHHHQQHQQQQQLSTRARRQLLHQARQNARAALTAPFQLHADQTFRRSRSSSASQPRDLESASFPNEKRYSNWEKSVAEVQILCDVDHIENGHAEVNKSQFAAYHYLHLPFIKNSAGLDSAAAYAESAGSGTSEDPRRRHSSLGLCDASLSIQPRARFERHLAVHTPSLLALTGGMDADDLFMQEAEGGGKVSPSMSRVDKVLGQGAQQNKRRSLPATGFRAATSMEERRPRTSGGLSNARLHHSHADDAQSVASYAGLENVDMRQRRSSRISSTTDRQPLSPRDRMRSPELTMYGRLRPLTAITPTTVPRHTSQLLNKLLESEGDSPAESSEPKQSLPESTSADSQTAPSTVWDELDDLKSRIKKLELTGKLPPTSGAAVVSQTSPQLDRPRTATTAPTTIDSSPKRDKTTEVEDDTQMLQPAAVGSSSIHPLLHSTLAKAKPLLNSALYRSLVATANDALQLAAMTGLGGAGLSSAVSGVNGGSADRQMRRKADTMCRNLTDLCLALCEGKHESTPMKPISAVVTTPVGRFSRAASRMDSDDRQGRPMSRLEARRSSILGVASGQSPGASVSPRREFEDLSASEVETPSQYLSVDRRRFSRSSSRFSTARSRYDEASGDEDPTLRPPSRNGSDFSFRSKQTISTREYGQAPQRSVSLREALGNRRSSGVSGHREIARMASMSSDTGRRWTRESTPPVLEEEVGEQDKQIPEALQLPRQRMTSLGHFRPSRTVSRTPLRNSSVSRHVPQVMIE